MCVVFRLETRTQAEDGHWQTSEMKGVAFSHWGSCVTLLQHWLNPFCSVVCYGRKRRRVARTCELYSVLHRWVNNPSPSPVPPLAWEMSLVLSCGKFSWLCLHSALDIRQTAWNTDCASQKWSFESIPLCWLYDLSAAKDWDGEKMPGIYLSLTLFKTAGLSAPLSDAIRC